MKSILLIVLPFFWCVYTSAQIKTVPSKSLVANGSIIKYDSLSNFIGNNVDSYINQTFYLPKTTGYEKKHGYQGFKKNLKGDIYQPVGYPKLTKYESVAGKYFDVIAIRRDTKAYVGDVYLELKESDNGKILYFDYKKDFDTSFPFLVVGYFEKQKQTFVGRKFCFTQSMTSDIVDMDTGQKIGFQGGTFLFSYWKCLDYYIKEDYVWKEMLILENGDGVKTEMSVFDACMKDTVGQEMKQKEAIRNKYGDIRLGLKMDVCRIICGIPNTINSMELEDGVHEQWVYDDMFLYFENGILTAIQKSKY